MSSKEAKALYQHHRQGSRILKNSSSSMSLLEIMRSYLFLFTVINGKQGINIPNYQGVGFPLILR